jgi:hypothetical protein
MPACLTKCVGEWVCTKEGGRWFADVDLQMNKFWSASDINTFHNIFTIFFIARIELLECTAMYRSNYKQSASVCLSLSLSVCVCVCVCVYLSLSVSLLSACLSFFLFICLLSLSISLPTPLCLSLLPTVSCTQVIDLANKGGGAGRAHTGSADVRVCAHVRMCACVRVHVCMCACACACVCVCAHIHIHIHPSSSPAPKPFFLTAPPPVTHMQGWRTNSSSVSAQVVRRTSCLSDVA